MIHDFSVSDVSVEGREVHPFKVIEQRKLPFGGSNDYEYYVHYSEFNRRLDEWVTLEQLDLDSVETVVDEKVEDKVTGLKMTRHQKRKIEETHVEPPLNWEDMKLRHGTSLLYEAQGTASEAYDNLCANQDTPKALWKFYCSYWSCDCSRLLFWDGQSFYFHGREKHSEESYNLASILTIPPYQRKGFGKFLIAFSYELSKKEGKVGTPESPLSDLGLVSYKGYWRRVLLDILKKHKGNISIKELSDMTAIKADDILTTLQSLELIQYRKGQHVVCADPKVLDCHLEAAGQGGGWSLPSAS